MSAPAAVIDVLTSLLEAEQNSVFRFMDEGWPYLSRATAEVRKPLQSMVDANHRLSGRLAGLIEQYGGSLALRPIRPDEQYLAFLSVKFLLPKLADEKTLMVRRYENAIAALGKSAPATVIELLRDQETEHRAHLEILKKAAAKLQSGR